MANKKKDTKKKPDEKTEIKSETKKLDKEADAKKQANKEPKVTSKKKEKSGTSKVVAIISAVLLVIIGVFLFLVLGPRPTPYVVANQLEISSAKDTYRNHVTNYTTNLDGEIIDVGSEFEESYATYNFYDYKYEGEDTEFVGNEIVSFKFDTVVPIKFTRKDYSYKDNYYYTYSIIWPLVFDYYTGEEYQKNAIRSENETDEEGGCLKYNEVTWNGKTYQIGVRTETKYKWDGKQKVADDTYTDTSKSTTIVYISAPKGYDGLMMAIFKAGSNQETFEGNRKRNERLKELKQQAEETGDKSEELIKMEYANDSMLELLQSRYDENKVYTKDDFYVFWVDDIKPAE